MKGKLAIIFVILLILFLLSTHQPEIPREVFIKSETINLRREIFTENEWNWILQNQQKVFSVGVALDYIPIEYLDRHGQPKGLGLELLKKVNEFTGLQFKLYEKNHFTTWDEILQNTKDKNIDILTAASFTEPRSAYLNFSIPYLELSQILVGHKNTELINNYDKIARATFAVPTGFWFIDTVLKNHSPDKIIYVKDTEEAIKAVANKLADYTICELPVYSYYKEQGDYSNLKIVGLLDKNQIFIAVRKDLQELIPIINKSISNTNSNELYESSLVMPENNIREIKLLLLIFLLLVLLSITIYHLQKTFKKLVQAKKEAEDANRDKTALMANISHDLRNPITVSMGYLEAILDDETKEKEDKEEYLKRTYRKLKHLSELIDDFFFISRLEDNKLKFYREKVNINSILKMVSENLELKVKSENLKLILKLDDKINIEKTIDKLKFYRAIENIIINAINYSKPNGLIEIGTLELPDGKVKIYIKDTGKGIVTEDLPFIFDRYYKGKNSRNDSIGLGLYITKEIIERHEGEIWAESKLNEGTTFYIIL